MRKDSLSLDGRPIEGWKRQGWTTTSDFCTVAQKCLAGLTGGQLVIGACALECVVYQGPVGSGIVAPQPCLANGIRIVPWTCLLTPDPWTHSLSLTEGLHPVQALVGIVRPRGDVWTRGMGTATPGILYSAPRPRSAPPSG